MTSGDARITCDQMKSLYPLVWNDLSKFKYAPGGDSTRVDIYLDIMSDQGRHALVVFSGGGGV